MGFVFLTMFGTLTLQLWRVQVVPPPGVDYVAEAEALQVKTVYTPAPRGQIVDRAGRQLAGTRPALAAVVDGSLVPEASVADLVPLLAAFTGLPAQDVEDTVRDAIDRNDRRVIKADLDEVDAVYLAEHGEDFAGVSVIPVPQRTYPYGNVASGVLGYIGRPGDNDIEEGAKPTDILGKAGLEAQYDDELQGTEGRIFFRVDAFQTVLEVLNEEFPDPGRTLALELDIELQAVMENALVEGLELARNDYNAEGCEPGEQGDSTEDKGCPVRAVGVAMNITDGAVLAMGSVPNFDPTIFVSGLEQSVYDALPEGALINFAVTGQYAPASTFKALTYAMAMEEGISPQDVDSVEDPIMCTGRLAKPLGEGSQQVFQNWTRADDGLQNIHDALMRSCNTYFWELTYALWEDNKGTDGENLLQNWAREVGFDQKTGIDLPSEKPGIIPDRDLFVKWAGEDDPRLDPSRLAFVSPWFGGDLFQAAVGQGSVLATPIQMATAYGALVNGGTVWQPRVVHEIRTEDGTVVIANPKSALNIVEGLSASTVRSLRNDLRRVVNNPRGTAYAAFRDFGDSVDQVGGKTGTAEIIKRQTDDDGNITQEAVTTALFVGVAPISDPEYVVVVIIERGGSGGGLAAPTAKPILQHLLGETVTPVAPGDDAD